jgi:hypothetical protein
MMTGGRKEEETGSTQAGEDADEAAAVRAADVPQVEAMKKAEIEAEARTRVIKEAANQERALEEREMATRTGQWRTLKFQNPEVPASIQKQKEALALTKKTEKQLFWKSNCLLLTVLAPNERTLKEYMFVSSDTNNNHLISFYMCK